MTNYLSLNWKTSPAHIKCLSLFLKPKSRKRVAEYSFLQYELSEEPNNALQRFLDQGLLVTPPLNEIIDHLHNKGSIEDALRSRRLNSAGSKSQVINRLITHAIEVAEELVKGHDVLTCSLTAREFLSAYEIAHQNAKTEVRNLVFTALLKSDIKEALEIFSKYQEEFVRNDGRTHISSYDASIMEILLTKSSALLEHLNQRDRQYLRAATCMSLFWRDEKAERWLPENFATTFQNKEVICHLFKKFAETQNRIGNFSESASVTIVFEPYDIDSCEICRKMDGNIVRPKDMPELPDLRCTSKRGCQFHLRYNSSNDIKNSNNEPNVLDSGESYNLSQLLPATEYEDFKTHTKWKRLE